MSTTFLSNFLSSGIALLAFTVVPILFTIIYPNRLRGLACCVFVILHNAVVYYCVSLFGFETIIAQYTAIAEAFLWTIVAGLIMDKISSFKEDRTAEFKARALPWHKRDNSVRILLTSLLVVEFVVFVIAFVKFKY